jgi:hypothetical protein
MSIGPIEKTYKSFKLICVISQMLKKREKRWKKHLKKKVFYVLLDSPRF